MGWLSEHECLSPLDSPHSRLVLQQLTSATSRWLSRFVIIKGGHVYLFKFPPVAILKAFKNRLAQSSRRNHSGSSGSSLGSVGSSTSDASTSSTGSAHFSLNAASTSSDLLMTKTRNSKLDKVEKANQDLEKDLLAASSHCFVTCKCDFRIVKPNELFDAKHFCFLLNTGAVTKRYFSTESEIDLQKLQAAWTRSNFYSVTKFKVGLLSLITWCMSNLMTVFLIYTEQNFYRSPWRWKCFWISNSWLAIRICLLQPKEQAVFVVL